MLLRSPGRLRPILHLKQFTVPEEGVEYAVVLTGRASVDLEKHRNCTRSVDRVPSGSIQEQLYLDQACSSVHGERYPRISVLLPIGDRRVVAMESTPGSKCCPYRRFGQ